MTYFRQQIPALMFAVGLSSVAVSPALAEPDCDKMFAQARRGEQMNKMREHHHHKLYDALNLNADQKPAWESLMASERPKDDLTRSKPEPEAGLTTIERAELRLARTKAYQERMTVHVAALRNLYATLTPDQQKIFEEFHSQQRTGIRRKPAPRHGAGG